MEEAKSSKIGGIIVIAFFTLLAMGAAGLLFFVYTQRPDVVEEIRLKFETIGLIEPSPIEQTRRYDINQLPITYEKKQILLSRTIFLGATPKMVQLALGDPKEARKGGDGKIYFIYHLAKDPMPTMLQFDEGKLSHAGVVSAIDLHPPQIYTGMNSE